MRWEGAIQKPAPCYTYPQLLIQKAVTVPGSKFNRHGGSTFNRRQHPDLNVIATGLAAPVAVLLVKTLLDFSLAHFFVKYFWCLPVRGLFRDRPQDISGNWEQSWGSAGSPDFENDTDRHSHAVVRQFGRYCYAEFYAKGVLYCLFGKIENAYLVGNWYDKKDKHAYFGAFQLRIVDGQTLDGKYVGHSRRTCVVQQDDWKWEKN